MTIYVLKREIVEESDQFSTRESAEKGVMDACIKHSVKPEELIVIEGKELDITTVIQLFPPE